MELETTLPVGIEEDGSVLKTFSLNDLRVRDTKKINDRGYKQNYPIRWLGTTVSRVMRELEGRPISQEFKQNNQIPGLVKEMTMTDLNYVLVLGHIHNMGMDLGQMKVTCPACRNYVPFQINLENIDWEQDRALEAGETYVVELDKGFEHQSQGAEQLGTAGKTYKIYEFRHPKLKDALAHEDQFSGDPDSTFPEELMTECLVRVEATDGSVLSDKQKRAIGTKLILNLFAKDMRKISQKHNSLTGGFNKLVEQRCNNCGQQVEVPLASNLLYQV